MNKWFKISAAKRKASIYSSVNEVINILYGLDTAFALHILRDYIDKSYFNFDKELSKKLKLKNFRNIYNYLVDNYPTTEELFDKNILDLEGHLDENTADHILSYIKYMKSRVGFKYPNDPYK